LIDPSRQLKFDILMKNFVKFSLFPYCKTCLTSIRKDTVVQIPKWKTKIYDVRYV